MVAYEETARARARAKLANRAVQRETSRAAEVSQIQALHHAADEDHRHLTHGHGMMAPPGAPMTLAPALEPPPWSVLNAELGREVHVPVRHPVLAAVVPAPGASVTLSLASLLPYLASCLLPLASFLSPARDSVTSPG